MATTWDGVTIPSPVRPGGYNRSRYHEGSQRTMADGSLTTDTMASGYTLTLRFEYITETERDTLETKWLASTADAAKTIAFDNGDSFSVEKIEPNFTADALGKNPDDNPHPLFNVSCTVRTV